MAHIVIGILAHNEAHRIPPTIKSLFRQDVFLDPRHRVEVVVVANGCKDETAATAAAAGAEAIKAQGIEQRTALHVLSIPEPGKCNAWNRFVHGEFVVPGCLVALMDADIQFPDSTTFSNLADDLLSNPELKVAVSTPTKSFDGASAGVIARALSKGVSGNDPNTICGQLYMAREVDLRDLWLPSRLQVEDGFLRAMIVTNQFRNQDEPWRVRWSTRAFHHYEPYLEVGQLIRHETWLVSNEAACAHIFGELWKLATAQKPAGVVIAELNETTPDWVEQLLRRNLGRKPLAVHTAILWRRLGNLRRARWGVALKKLPTALAATVLDWIVYYKSNARVKQWIRRGDMRSN